MKISEKASNGPEFCQLIGYPVSTLKDITRDKEHDCFNGHSTVGPKYTRLDIDFKLVNERDFPDPEEHEYRERHHAMDWDWIDE